MSATWEINLGGAWKPMGNEESAFLEELVQKRETKGELQLRGQKYSFNVADMTQTNMATSKARSIRRKGPPLPQPMMNDTFTNFDATNSTAEDPGRPPRMPRSETVITLGEEMIVQVWLAGDWKRLKESKEIARRQEAGERKFVLTSRGAEYEIDLDQMTQTNLTSKRIRTIRFASSVSDPTVGFDDFRNAFRERDQAKKGKITIDGLQLSWTTVEAGEETLRKETVQLAVKYMDLRKNGFVDLTEWSHFWAMERDSPSYVAGKEVNDKIANALKEDPQVLGRMQMHFETACGETDSHHGLSREGLLHACKRLVADPRNLLEKKWAAEVLQKESELEDDEELTYFDFLNVMLGRKKFKVSLWKYDISDGKAKQLSWMLLGHHFEGIWHTGVVVEWPERSSEFWFGGNLFESVPGQTPFGEPVEKMTLGYTFKLREEVWQHVARKLAHEFTSANYDVLTHNCNHFSDTLSMFLRNEHIPTDVRMQPEMVMNTITARALRPLLNRWLGNFGDTAARATDGGEEDRKMWTDVLPGALIQFSKEEGGRPLIGQVTDLLSPDYCTVRSLDFWKGEGVERDIPREFVSKVVQKAPPGAQVFAYRRESDVKTISSVCCPISI